MSGKSILDFDVEKNIYEENDFINNGILSRIMKWCKWCPTSPNLLQDAENKLFSNINVEYKKQYINIGCIVDEKDDSNIWTLSFNEHSPNTPLVLIHGLGSGVGMWILNLESLARNRPVYAFDIIGFGQSSRPLFDSNSPIMVERQFINAIETWREKISLNKKFILVGHSFGAFLSASYAIEFSQYIAHLVLVDPWGFIRKPEKENGSNKYPYWLRFSNTFLKSFNPYSLIRLAGPTGKKLIELTRADIIQKFSYKIDNAKHVISNYLYHCIAQNPSGETAFHTLMNGFIWAKYPIISRLDVLDRNIAITLIYGSNTWIDAKIIGSQIKEKRKGSYFNIYVIKDVGHHINIESVDLFNDCINTIGCYCDKGEIHTECGRQIERLNLKDSYCNTYVIKDVGHSVHIECVDI